MNQNENSFEDAITELERIVDRLEKGELPLDASLEVFQRGIELSKFCSKRLDEIEKKISILIVKENGEIAEEPFKLDVLANAE